MRILIGVALLAHALIHASYLSPAPPRTPGGPEWPFEMSKSWLVTGMGVTPDVVRLLGSLLVVVSVVTLVAGGLATLGILPREWWAACVVVGAVASGATLTVFFHPWIVPGFVIDVALLWAVFVARWHPFGSTLGA